MRAIGKSGARSDGPMGFPVPGWSTGLRGPPECCTRRKGYLSRRAETSWGSMETSKGLTHRRLLIVPEANSARTTSEPLSLREMARRLDRGANMTDRAEKRPAFLIWMSIAIVGLGVGIYALIQNKTSPPR